MHGGAADRSGKPVCVNPLPLPGSGSEAYLGEGGRDMSPAHIGNLGKGTGFVYLFFFKLNR